MNQSSHSLLPGIRKVTLSSFGILLIEDSATVRKIVVTTLASKGYHVEAFPDGIEALRWLAESGSWTPNLILVDLGLPKMDGYEVIRRIKAKPRFTRTRCMILSRRDGTIDKLKGRLAGAAAYLTKPFTVQELLTTVHNTLICDPGYQNVNSLSQPKGAHSINEARQTWT